MTFNSAGAMMERLEGMAAGGAPGAGLAGGNAEGQ
jgi:hypothetical protein